MLKVAVPRMRGGRTEESSRYRGGVVVAIVAGGVVVAILAGGGGWEVVVGGRDRVGALARKAGNSISSHDRRIIPRKA